MCYHINKFFYYAYIDEVQITMEKSTSYAREFSGTLPDSELELEKVFKGNPNVWGFLESMNTTIVQSKLLERSPVSPTKTVESTNMDRYAYLIGSGPTCDIRYVIIVTVIK